MPITKEKVEKYAEKWTKYKEMFKNAMDIDAINKPDNVGLEIEGYDDFQYLVKNVWESAAKKIKKN